MTDEYANAVAVRLLAIEGKLNEMHVIIFGPPGNPLPTGLRGMLAKVMDKVDQTERQRGLDREAENEREKNILLAIERLETTRSETRGGWRAVREIGTALAVLFSGISGLVALTAFLLHLGGKL